MQHTEHNKIKIKCFVVLKRNIESKLKTECEIIQEMIKITKQLFALWLHQHNTLQWLKLRHT